MPGLAAAENADNATDLKLQPVETAKAAGVATPDATPTALAATTAADHNDLEYLLQ
jgi:hypothetical protein